MKKLTFKKQRKIVRQEAREILRSRAAKNIENYIRKSRIIIFFEAVMILILSIILIVR